MTSAVGRAVVVLLAVVTLAGCAATSGGGDVRQSNLVVGRDAARALNYVPNWATDIPLDGGSRVAHVKVLDDVVVLIEQPSGIVTTLSIRDGSVLWRRAVQQQGNDVFAPARWGDSILVNTSTRLWQFRVRDGEALNVFEIGRVVSTGPLVVEDEAILGGIDGTVISKSLRSGTTQWEYRLTDHFVAPLVRVGNNILAVDASGIYTMLNPNGRMSWRGRTFGAITAEPAADGANAYIASHDGTLYALERGTGRDQWTYRTQSKLSLPAKSFDLVVVLPIPGEGVVGLDTTSGEVRWTIEDAQTLAVTRRGDDIVLAGVDRLMLVDLASGRVRADAKTQSIAAVRPGPDDSLIVVAPDGRVLRLNPTK